jgi:excisionase family DNA binding protein
MPEMSKFISTQEAANLLGISPVRVRQLIEAGRLPAQKVGRDWIIEETALATVAERPNGWPKGRARQSG